MLTKPAQTNRQRGVNSILVMRNWRIGKRIYQDILKANRTEYGKQIVKQLAGDLRSVYGDGCDNSALARMVKFSKTYEEEQLW